MLDKSAAQPSFLSDLNQAQEKMMSVELKIKAKSLAEEARIIKKEEAKQLRIARRLESLQRESTRARFTFEKLRDHRRVQVRWAARATHLCRAYLKAQPYGRVEGCVKQPMPAPVFNNLISMTKRYGEEKDTKKLADNLREWLGQV